MIAVLAPGGLKLLGPNDKTEGFKIHDEWTAPARSQAEAFIIRATHRIDRQILDESPRLKLIIMQGTGVDHIDEAECRARSIVIRSTPGINSTAAAEWTSLLILSLFRNFELARTGFSKTEWNRDLWAGQELRSKKIGLLGLGQAGRRVAKRLRAFESEVFAFDPYLDDAVFKEHEVIRTERDHIFRDCDCISLHLPLSSETKHSVGEREFNLISKPTFLVNTARGGILVE